MTDSIDRLEELGDWAWETNADHEISAVTTGVLQAMGLEGGELRTGSFLEAEGWLHLFEPQPVYLRQRLAARLPFNNIYMLARHGSGVPLVIEIRGAPYYDEQQRYRGYRGVSTVLAEKLATQLLIEHFQERLEDREGADYFSTLVKVVSRILDLDCVFVGRFQPGSQPVMQTQSVWCDGEYLENFWYQIEGTPCAQVQRDGEVAVSEGVSDLFRDAPLLRKQGFEAYLGQRLQNREGEAIGLLVCLHRQPLRQIELANNLFKVLVRRVESELYRLSTEQVLRMQKTTLAQAQVLTGFGSWRFELQEQCFYFSASAWQMLSGSSSTARELPLELRISIAEVWSQLRLRALGHRRALLEFWRSVTDQDELRDSTFAWQSPGLGLRWFRCIANRQRTDDAGGGEYRITGVLRDVTEERNAIRQLRLLSEAVDQASNSISITDLDARLIYVNPAFCRVTGYSREEVLGHSVNMLSSGLTQQENYLELWDSLGKGEHWRGEFVNRRKDGSLYWSSSLISPLRDEDGQISNYLSVQEDVSLRKEQEDQLRHRAHHDALTDLPNRLLAFERLKHSIVQARRQSGSFTLMFIDLDNFKQINDSLGHDAGDQLLQKVARRLLSTLREGDTVARLGGDEFLVILESSGTAAAELSALRIRHVLGTPMVIEGRELFVTASIGLTSFPEDGDTPELLMRNADMAMYRAKAKGKNTFRFFTASMNGESEKRLLIETELRRALARNEIHVHYQPVVDIASGRIVSAEALARWSNPTLGEVSPLEFIPLAEELGLIADISDYIIDQAVAQCVRWHRYDPTLSIAINISPRQLRDSRLYGSLRDAIGLNNINPQSITLEVTEGVLVENVQAALGYLQRLSDMGVNLAIDDFGTGYSSLSYVKNFPFSHLKIDRSFVVDCEDEEGQLRLLRVMVDLAHQFHLTVIAEGVETAAQLQLLSRLGADMYQGYHCSAPLAADAFTDLLLQQGVLDSAAGVDVERRH
ncbi:bifunctional diguanylate cyclase/phosphodiesterase [Pseudomaricurvus sp. HS19]|uniref:putative bifunctional diguanylate cyclase/phosphodiesterase n=1 Tax=Pseudomaricurvus sp. HS19 TaxID=2692626 RepID=UPI00136FE112|nr:EAL domain-containing protein [Pseudomaricurvus sp. HS19]MYM62450.1 EAL domain-containing protein [Pseudomaricurvus sp. HS19]